MNTSSVWSTGCHWWQSVIASALLGLALGGTALAQHTEVALSESFELEEYGITLNYPAHWSLAPRMFVNSDRLINVPADLQGKEPFDSRIKIFVEPRLNRDDGLREFNRLVPDANALSVDIFSLDGHPAIQTQRLDDRPQPSRGPKLADHMVLRVNTAIMADRLLVHLDASLPSDADAALVDEVLDIVSSFRINARADEDWADRQIDRLRQQQAAAGNSQNRSGTAEPEVEEELEPDAVQTPPSRLNQRIFAGGFGELEIAVSPDSQNVVVGRQSAWVASNDGGLTFPQSGTIGAFDGGDPSLAWAQSGAFYYAGIDRLCTNPGNGYLNPPAPSAFGDDCTGFAVSTDNGASFVRNTINPAVICPRDDPNNPGTVPNQCFPDQEHIAADRVNAGTGDQVYSTWRNFDAADQDAGLVCTQDSGQNWTAPLDLGSNSFFPRIATGQDGFVYVVAYGNNYRVWKFSSCANGLTLQAGFPVTIGARTPVDCPFPGHDRCDQNPTSQTLAVDDTNPNHLYFAYAQADGTTNRDATIFVRDSLDGGATWRAPVRANVNVPGPRIMPWICSTDGDALVTWFDRRAAPPCPNGNCPGIQNDLTHYYAGQLGLDLDGNLNLKREFRISEVDDPWCGPPNVPWPAATRQALNPAPGASEGCSLQPQLGGRCCLDADSDGSCDAQPPNWSGNPCDISDSNCPAGEVCLGGGGVPRYGDYNGNACAAGRLFAAWPSATSPPGVPGPNPGAIGILYDAFLVGAVPMIQVPNGLNFESCLGKTFRDKLTVCNTGNENLLVSGIDSDNANFAVVEPSGSFPVQISPDFCFSFEVDFNPSDIGTDSAVLTVNSNDPANPEVEVDATAEVGAPAINVALANSGDFGNVCRSDHADLNLSLFNQGQCDLTIGSIDILPPGSPFELPSGLSFPLVLSHDADFNIPVRYAPEACSDVPDEAIIRITSDDPDNDVIDIDISGVSPCPNLVIDPGSLDGLFAFPATVVDSGETLGCHSNANVVLRNNGGCPLTIDDISAAGISNALDFSVTAPSQFPILLPAGEETLDVNVRFTPQEDNLPLEPTEFEGLFTVISDDPDGEANADLCGEGVARSGVRMLVTDLNSGPPVIVDPVERIVLRSKGINKPGPINMTFTNVQAESADVCGNTVHYHVNQETLPSTDTTGGSGGGNASYEARAKQHNQQIRHSFTLGQCEFKEFQLQLGQ